MAKPVKSLLRAIRMAIAIITIVVLAALTMSYLSAYVSPATVWWFQLFGLAYPVLAIGSIIGIIALYFIHKKWMFAGLIILLIGKII